MATVQEATPGSQDIGTFQAVVQQQEGIFGPLTALASQIPNNIMTFQVGPSPDTAHRATLTVFTDHPAQKDGCVLICVGNCLVNGTPQSIAAYRKTP